MTRRFNIFELQQQEVNHLIAVVKRIRCPTDFADAAQGAIATRSSSSINSGAM